MQNILVKVLKYQFQKSRVMGFYTVSQKIDTAVAHHNFNTDQPILVILAEMVR